jgi:hypothetical protein
MEHVNPNEELKFIKGMIEKSREIVAGSWMFFLAWGILIIIAIVGMYTLAILKKFEYIWMNWILWMGLGMGFTLFYKRKVEQKREVISFTHRISSYAGMATGIGFIFTGFIFPMAGVYSWEAIPVLISTMAGIMVFIMGAVFEWKLLLVSGILWWVGALIMIPIPGEYRSLLFIPFILIGYIWPALSLRKKYYEREISHV